MPFVKLEKLLPKSVKKAGIQSQLDSAKILESFNQVIEKFLTQMPVRMEVAEEDVRLSGVLIEIDSESGKANTIERVQEKM